MGKGQTGKLSSPVTAGLVLFVSFVSRGQLTKNVSLSSISLKKRLNLKVKIDQGKQAGSPKS